MSDSSPNSTVMFDGIAISILVLSAAMIVIPSFLAAMIWAGLIVSVINRQVDRTDILKTGIYLLSFSIMIFSLNSTLLEYSRIYLFDGIRQLNPKFITVNRLRFYLYIEFWLATAAPIVLSVYFLFFKKKDRKSRKDSGQRLGLIYQSPYSYIVFGLFLAACGYLYMDHSLFVLSYMIETKLSSHWWIDGFNGYWGENFATAFTWHIWLFGSLLTVFFVFNTVVLELIFSLFGRSKRPGARGLVDVMEDAEQGKGLLVGRLNNSPLRLEWKDINHHIHIIGQPGSGKSVLLRNIYSGIIAQGEGLLMIDLKADVDVKSELNQIAIETGRTRDVLFFDVKDPKNSIGYNPLLRGTATELKDKIVMALEWSEPFYKKKAEYFLLTFFRAMVICRDELGELMTLKDVYECLKNVDMVLSIREKIPLGHEELRADLVGFHKDLTQKEERNYLTGLKTDLGNLINSDFGKLLTSGNSIDLLEIIRNKQVLYILLDGQQNMESSQKIARLLISEIRSCSGEIVSKTTNHLRPKFSVIIDEFSDIVSTPELGSMFAGLLNRCRGSGIGCVIAHQSFGDFKDKTVQNQLVDNTETTISFVIKDSESAELLAAMVGTKPTEQLTYQIKEDFFGVTKSGMGSLRDTQEYIFHPNTFKNLGVGEAIYFAKKPSRFGQLSVEFLDIKHRKFSKTEVKKRQFSPFVLNKPEEKISKSLPLKKLASEKKEPVLKFDPVERGY